MYKNLSLLLPAKNELLCIDKVFKELEKINFNSQVLLVVDSIKDNTLNFKKKKYSFKIIKVITNKKGYGAAVIEGIKNATKVFKKVNNENLVTIGVGDNFNDLEMLRNSDFPCLVFNDKFTLEKININNCIVSKKPAPEGWEEIVKMALDKIKQTD